MTVRNTDATHHLAESSTTTNLARSGGDAGNTDADLSSCVLRTIRYSPGESFIPAQDGFYYLQSGTLALWAVHVDGEGSITEFLGPSDALRVTAVELCYYECLALDITTVCELDRRRLLRQVDAAQAFHQRQVRRLDRLRVWTACQQRMSVEDRLWGVLHLLAEQFGAVCSDGTIIDLPLTHRLLAAATGSTRSTVTRTLNRLLSERRLRQYTWFGQMRYVLPATLAWTPYEQEERNRCVTVQQ